MYNLPYPDKTRLYAERNRRNRGILPRPKFLERIWNNIQECGHGWDCPYCCWPWLRTCRENGYGIITVRVNDIQICLQVTHIVYEIWNGRPIPPGKLIAHHCDNPPCANPLHLWPATAKENMEDAARKGRMPKGLRNGKYTKPEARSRGESHGMVKLSNDDILTIRFLHEEGESNAMLAQRYKVSTVQIWRIVTKRNRTDI